MNVSLEEAFSGVQRDITVNVPVECDGCNGTGSSEGSQPRNCGTCGGSGRVRAQQGFFAVERTCHTCHGMGQVISDPCRNCGGEGRVMQNKVLSVSVPAGVDTGTESACPARARPVFVAIGRRSLYFRLCRPAPDPGS